MANQLIDTLEIQWRPEKFEDKYREQVLELIKKKAAGEEIVTPPAVEPSGQVVDLMAALQESIERAA